MLTRYSLAAADHMGTEPSRWVNDSSNFSLSIPVTAPADRVTTPLGTLLRFLAFQVRLLSATLRQWPISVFFDALFLPDSLTLADPNLEKPAHCDQVR